MNRRKILHAIFILIIMYLVNWNSRERTLALVAEKSYKSCIHDEQRDRTNLENEIATKELIISSLKLAIKKKASL
ncbi:MAG: hypothetical protein R8N23_08800 [Reichenbachiella sp.]|uniref:hypothetical protein n=1 Tax=Reichenbachiella sp. TaxID=2184521 RepID=UPI002965DE69|nr:hypothetical protein [Reichenbachiella sp.]MDW3209952.1 hypothetical protein [Reichenbachiella sp.]